MPYAWFMPVIPIWLLRADYDHLPRFFRKYVVRRTNSVIYENEFNIEPPVMQLTSEAYPSYNLVVSVDFSAAAHMPADDAIVALRIKNHAVTRIRPDYDQVKKKIVFRIDELRNERLRISWPLVQGTLSEQ